MMASAVDERIRTTLYALSDSLPTRFRRSAVLAIGRVCFVFSAIDVQSGAEVVVKVLRPELRDSCGWRHRFEREAAVLQSLEGAHVPAYVEWLENNRTIGPALVMRRVPGVPLDELPRLTVPRATNIALAVCDALASIHQRGYLHLDVSHGNLIWNETTQRATVIDVGLAQRAATGPGGLDLGADANILSARYASPQRCLGEPVDARDDIYSLGVVVFQLFTGVLPTSATLLREIVLERIAFDIPCPRRLSHTVPEATATVLRRMLHFDRPRRYASVTDVRAAIVDANEQEFVCVG